MSRFFNTSGPCKQDIHYTIDPLSRLKDVRQLIDQQKYFVLHAPRQTGKTTTILALIDALNEEGKYIALYANVEPAQAVRNNVVLANESFVNAVNTNARIYLPKAYHPSPDCLRELPPTEALWTFLTRWCAALPKPLVLFIDEADSLIGDSLLSLLRQLRSGYTMRPKSFPHALALIGLRDIRDFRIWSEIAKRYEIGGSAFNIKDESLTMTVFSEAEVRTLYALHTAETGQAFTEEALKLVYEQTKGQPWLVNAIGRESCFGQFKVSDHQTVTADDVYRAIETLILRRDTHLDHLSDKLTEPRVARIMDLIISGTSMSKLETIPTDDIKYVMDLGLITRTDDGLGVANPIYREVIPRELTAVQEAFLPRHLAWYVGADGKLNIENVLTRFFEFYKENGEMLTKRKLYTEAAHHLVFMAWLQRIVNGGGYIRREYAAGLGFVDLVILFEGDKFVFELKMEKNFKRQAALDQVCEYALRMSVAECYLIVFRRKVKDIELVGQREVVLNQGLRVHLIWV